LASVAVAVYTPAAKPDTVVANVSPFVQIKDQPPTPPAGIMVVSPSECPLQLMSAPEKEELTYAELVTMTGSVTVILELLEHRFTSVVVAVYTPDTRPATVVAVVSPLDHR
jgi:hypothetical protein